MAPSPEEYLQPGSPDLGVDMLGSVPAYNSKTALVVVDIQNDFADPKGSLYVRGGEEIAGVVNVEIEKARAAGAPIVFTQDWHPSSTPHFEKDGGVWPVHCVAGTWGAQIYAPISIQETDPVIRKGNGGEDGYSGFTVADPTTGAKSATDLESMLRDRNVETVVIVGLATDYCVKATVIDSTSKGFKTFVLSDAIRAVDLKEGDGDLALEAMAEAGAEIA